MPLPSLAHRRAGAWLLASLALMLLGLAAAPAQAAAWRLSQEPGGFGDARGPVAAGPADRKLVVWWEERLAPGGRPDGFLAHARKVDARGRPRGPIRQLHGPTGAPQLVYNPRRREYLLAWSGEWDGGARGPCRPWGGYMPPPDCETVETEVHVQRLDGAGRPLEAPRRITATGRADDPAARSVLLDVEVDARRDRYLVAFEASEGDHDRRLAVQSLDGRAREIGVDDATIPTERSEAFHGSLASRPRGRGYVLLYSLHRRIREGDILGQRLDAMGAPDGTPVAVATGTGARRDGPVLLRAPRGPGYVAFWRTGTGQHPAIRVTAVSLDARARPTRRPSALTRWSILASPTAARLGRSRVLLAWTQESSTDSEIHTRLLDVRGRALGPARRRTRTGADPRPGTVNPPPGSARMPSLEPVTGGALLTFTAIDGRDRRDDAYARRLRR